MAAMTRCPRCGAENAPGLNFCGNCGMALTSAPPPGPPAPGGPPPAGPGPAVGPPPTGSPPPYVPYGAPGRGTGPLVAVIVVVAILVVGGAAAAFFLLRDDPPGTAKSPVTPVQSPVEPTQPADRVPESSLDELLPTELDGFTLTDIWPLTAQSTLEYGATDQITASYRATDGAAFRADIVAFPDATSAQAFLAFEHEYWLGFGYTEIGSFRVTDSGGVVRGDGYQVTGTNPNTGTLDNFFYWSNDNLEIGLAGPQPGVQQLFDVFPY